MSPPAERNIFEARSSLMLQNTVETRWDIAVIGAGPAGSVAASLLAAQGKRVVLIEKSAWPRDKVCGGCLNAAAVQALSSAGLASAFRVGQSIAHAIWFVGGKSLEMPAPGGVAILRSELDAGLVKLAIERGCTFLCDTAASLLPTQSDDDHRILRLKAGDVSKCIRAKVVLACDGIGGTSLESEPWATWKIQRNAWMGASVTCENVGSAWSLGAIHMHIGYGGYVGAVCLPDGRVHLAAALDPIRCRNAGGPGPLVEKILHSCGHFDFSKNLLRADLAPSPGAAGGGRDEDASASSVDRSAFPEGCHPSPLPDYRARGQENAGFRGTGLMTRRRVHLGGHRVLAIGDACGYVEPFTGEGMAWAIRSAIAAADLLQVIDHWPEDMPARWENLHHNLVQRKQRWCKALRPLVRHPSLALLGINTARLMPPIADFLSHQISESNCQHPASMQGAFG